MSKSIRSLYKLARNTGAFLALSGMVLQAPVMTYAADGASAFNNVALTKAYKGLNENNPIATQKYSADPGVMVYGDTVYVYATSDQVLYKNGSIQENTYGHINTLHCFSSKDLVNWTDHGVIQAAGQNGVAKWAGCSWAPCATYKKINGQDKFFLYFANNASGIGVLEADSPTGPWRDPIGKALIANCPGVTWLFDPAVFVDDDGTGYLYFGGGIPNNQYAHPKTARVVKLGANMTSLAGSPVVIDAPYLFEDSGINKIGNKYYYSYCSNFNTGGSEFGGGCIEYMVSNSPMGPFTYAGEVFKNPGTYFTNSGGNNHHTIFKFKDEYYIAYHTRTLEMAQFGKNYGYRSTHIDKLTVNNGNLSNVKGTKTGVSQVSYINPYNKVQAETMAIQAGVNVSGTGDTKVTDINRGDWIGVKGVNFSDGLSKITVSASSNTGGFIKVCTGSPSGQTLGYIEVPNTNGAYKEVTGTLSNVTGVKDLYFVFSNNMSLDYWKATSQIGQVTPETTQPDQPAKDTTITNYATLKDGWYYIKGIESNKYLQVTNNKGGDGVNVEIGTGTGVAGQKWYLKNTQNGYVTLKNGQGYTLDVVYGKDEDKTNIQTYTANGMSAQEFKIVPTSKSGEYGIVTRCSTDVRGLDVENKGTTDGSNVIQYGYYGAANQTWAFESCDGTTKQEESTTRPETSPTSGNVVTGKVTSDWGSGAVADITVTNTTNNDLNNWTCTFTTSRPIASVWNATIVSQTGNTYTISGPTWQVGLAKGASYTFGCQLEGSGELNFTNVSLK
ncbi:family 43 glycosylhydrolase [Cellulosilyticum ruminicola]|nr:family 43 glycosylhydrolase [Cellulosilyticum ruminicola]